MGCERGPVTFDSNRVFAKVLSTEEGVAMDTAQGDVSAILTEMFGTPDDPAWPGGEWGVDPAEVGAGGVQLDRLRRAAGRIYSDEDDVHFGLYREHCNSCHGVTGDGRGPAAMLQRPYPRDFRAGWFKYKSTPGKRKPTRADLLSTLRRGLPGVSMPSFGLLVEEDLEALVDYVVYLSVRGELERRMLRIAAQELDYDDPDGTQWLRPQDRSASPELAAEQREWISNELAAVLASWDEAESQRTVVPEVPSDLDAAERVARGGKWYHGAIANCATCHGAQDSGGEGLSRSRLVPDYDDWTKEWTTQVGLDPADRGALSEYLDAGAFRPRVLEPRNLQHGVYRGGANPEQLYLRLVQGITGSPMPALNVVEEPSGAGLTVDQVWDLVAYLRSLAPAGTFAAAGTGDAAGIGGGQGTVATEMTSPEVAGGGA